MRTTTISKSMALLAFGWLSLTARAEDLKDSIMVDIGAQPIEAALLEFSKQTGLQLVIPTGALPASTTSRVSGSMSPAAALNLLLKDTALTYKFIGNRTVSIVPPGAKASASLPAPEGVGDPQSIRLTQVSTAQVSGGATRSSDERASAGQPASPKGIPEILVTGSRTLNMDIQRDRDAPQPYTIFEREQLERSGSVSVEDFLKTRLTMNTQSTMLSQQTAGAFANNSSINLRGMGAAQTLILVDGRRLPGHPAFGNSGQADISGIPLSAIERIEVLPTTASGIYGGSATGGVVNIIMRRDYQGAELGVKYENTTRSDAPSRRIDGAGGFNLFGGKTNVMIAGSYADGDQPQYKDRNFWRRGREAVLANTNNDYSALDPATTYLLMGATTNIRSVSGANLVLDNGTALGSAITYVPYGYTGLSSGDGGAALAAQAGRYNIDQTIGSHTLGGGGLWMGQDPELKSLSLTLRQEISPRLQAFLQSSYSENITRFKADRALGQSLVSFVLPATSAGNPFQQDIRVQVPATSTIATLKSGTESKGVSGGLIVRLPKKWMTELDYSWSKVEFDFYNPFVGLSDAGRNAVINGAVDIFADATRYPISFSPYLPNLPPVQGHFDTTMKNASVRAAGPLWTLPGGDAQLTAMVEYRDEQLGDGLNGNLSGEGLLTRYFYPSRSQSVKSAYMELRLPLISARNSLPAVQALEMQLALRRDDYTTNGVTGSVIIPSSGIIGPVERRTNTVSSTDPTVALRYQPLEDVAFRASYGTGFLPPSVGQVVPGASLPGASGGGYDPLRGGTLLGNYSYLSGGNPNLKPEDSKTYSMGLVLTPRFTPGFRLSLDYIHIKKTNNIASVSVDTLLTYFPERITRGPNLPGDPAGWAGPVTGVDATLVNVAGAELEAYDLQADYGFDTAAGRFDLFAMATRQMYYRQQFTPDGAITDSLAITSSNPLKLKGNMGVNWSRNEWSLGWTARYFDDYVAGATAPVNLRQGNNGRVDSQIYHDLFVSYKFGAQAPMGLLVDTDITLGIKNLFDEEPPFDANNIVNGYYSTFGDPRLASYWLNIKKNF